MKIPTKPIPSIQPRTGHPKWDSERFPTMESSFDLRQRVSFIIQMLRKESWLPLVLRENILDKCAHIIEMSFAGKLDTDTAKQLVESLAAAAYEYEEMTLQSSTLCQIRTLDLEMNNQLGAYKIRQEAVV